MWPPIVGRFKRPLALDVADVFRLALIRCRIFALFGANRSNSASNSSRFISCNILFSLGFCDWSLPMSPNVSSKVRAATAFAFFGDFGSSQIPRSVKIAKSRNAFSSIFFDGPTYCAIAIRLHKSPSSNPFDIVRDPATLRRFEPSREQQSPGCAQPRRPQNLDFPSLERRQRELKPAVHPTIIHPLNGRTTAPFLSLLRNRDTLSAPALRRKIIERRAFGRHRRRDPRTALRVIDL